MVSLAPTHWADTVPLLAPPAGEPDWTPAARRLALPPDVLDSLRSRLRTDAARQPERPATHLHRLVEDLCGLGVVLRPEPQEVATAPPLVPGSKEFNRRNERRFELIQKRVRHGLAADEEAEFQQLQAEIVRAARERFPLPPLPRPVRPSATGGPPA